MYSFLTGVGELSGQDAHGADSVPFPSWAAVRDIAAASDQPKKKSKNTEDTLDTSDRKIKSELKKD